VPLSLERVREQLLRAGISPREANRYVGELREHLADLTERERRAGLDGKAAADRARDLLGSEAQLVQAMIEKTPRSLSARAPWAVFTLLPVLALFVAILAIDMSMMRLLGPVQATWRAGGPHTYLGIAKAVSFATNYLLGPLFVAACIALALRQRLSSQWFWIGMGLIAVLSGLFGFHINVFPLADGRLTNTSFSAAPVVFVDGRVSPAATLSLVALRAAVLFIVAALAFRSLRSRLISGEAL
jgi:hypothetical protein